MGKKKSTAKSASKDNVPAGPPPELMDLVENFLSEHSFTGAHDAFKRQREKKGWQAAGAGEPSASTSLVGVFQSWEASNTQPKAAPSKKDASSDDSSDSDSSDEEEDVDMKDAAEDDSSSDSSSSSSDSDSDSDEEAAAKPAKQQASKNLKRKAPESSSESESSSDSSSSDSSSDSDSDDEPKAKKQKRAKSVSSSSSSSKSSSDSEDSDSSSSSGSDEEAGADSESSSSDSSSDSSDSDSDSGSDSDSESESETKKETKAAAKVPLPESDDSSSDSSDSDDDEESDKANDDLKDASDSSVTLDKTSPEFQPNSGNPPLPPDPVANGQIKANGRKQQNEAFSRIPKDIKVDPRFSSNAYVPIAYSQRAHEDLIVTKGKGFTKEKNKKKRGSYRGGAIDISDRKGIYFDD